MHNTFQDIHFHPKHKLVQKYKLKKYWNIISTSVDFSIHDAILESSNPVEYFNGIESHKPEHLLQLIALVYMCTCMSDLKWNVQNA